jgi:hypothetical protein
MSPWLDGFVDGFCCAGFLVFAFWGFRALYLGGQEMRRKK